MYLHLTERREHLCEDDLLIPHWVVAVLLDRGLTLQEGQNKGAGRGRIRGLEGAKKGAKKGAGGEERRGEGRETN